MFRYPPCFLLLFLLHTGCCQAQYYNGQVRIDSADRSYLFQITDTPAQPFHFEQYYWFKSGRIHHTQGSYYGKLLHGYYKVVDKQRRLLEEGQFRMGLKTGLWRTWHENGMLKSSHRRRVYDKALLIREYDEDGNLIRKGVDKKGLFTGSRVEQVGDSLVVVRYKNGVALASKK